jgi:hypothetical protein
MSGDWQNVDYSLLGDEHVRRYRDAAASPAPRR